MIVERATLLICLGLLVLPDPAAAQLGVTVETSTAARRKLRLVDEYLRREAWAEAVSFLRQTLEQHAGELVEVAAGRYLDTTAQVNRMLVNMPPQALTIYREAVDPQARRWFESGRTNNDPLAVSRLLKNAYASRWTDEALWWLGQAAWQANRPRHAAGYWRQLLPTDPDVNPIQRSLRFPDSRHAEADVRARLVLCHCLDGRLDLARAEWVRLKRRNPDARGSLAGRKGRLVELVARWLEQPGLWPAPPAATPHTTFGGSPERNGTTIAALDPAAPLWQARLDDSLSAGRSVHTDRFPVAWGDRLFVADSFGIRGWKLASGQPAWAANNTRTDRHVLFPSPPYGVPVRAARQRAGRVCTSLCVAGGRLYARIGSAVTAQSAQEPRPLFHELVGLDLEQGEGRLVLQLDTTKLPGDDSRGTWSFDGAPLVIGEKLYVTTRRGHPQAELGVSCFDTASGQVDWHRRLAVAVTRTDETLNVVTHNLLAHVDDHLVYSGDSGVVASLEIASGTIDWVTAFDPPGGPGPFCGLPAPASELILVRTGPESLAAVDLHDGHTVWKRQLPGGVEHLLALREGLAIVSGHSLWALNISTGQLAWHRLAGETHQHGHGRGLVAGTVVYWPTREQLMLLDLRSGRPLRQPVQLDFRGCTGGNLLLSPRGLVVCGGGRLTVLGQFAGHRPDSSFRLSLISPTSRSSR
ncbi:MAG: hypothetical protein CMJ65_06320 [Planctomycetaceae bacterium]|jgi:outer membrane protein assembly factor BamB|nr:hypothetical protein [Planctomycetaceae bacterium]